MSLLDHGQRRSGKGARAFGVGFSLAAHAAVLAAMFSTLPQRPKPVESPPMAVSMVEGPRLTEVLALAPSIPAPTVPPPPQITARPTPARRPVDPLPTAETPSPAPAIEVSDGELAGATTAESGPAGRTCNMAQFLQTALRKDPMVQAAVANAHRLAGSTGKAMMVWNGDWVRSGTQDGKGLAAVREALMWEIAFAPEACRAEPVRGLVLISLSDGAGSPRLVMGQGEWRWSDLLVLHPYR